MSSNHSDQTQLYVSKLYLRDETVLNDIQKVYGNAIKSIAYRITRSREDTEEIANDVLNEVWNTIPPLKPSSFFSLICSITKNKSIDIVRHKSAKKRSNCGYYEISQELESNYTVDDVIVKNIVLTESIESFLNAQSKENKYIFLRRYYDFASIKDIAKELKLNKNTVNLRLIRMRSQLKAILLDEGIQD